MNLHQSVGFMISSTARKLNTMLTGRFADVGLTSEQWAVLNVLAEEDGINQKELSCRTRKDPTNVTRILDQLERKGFVCRKANPDDRRSFHAYVTEAGRAANERLAPLEAELIGQVLNGFTEDEISVLRSMLTRLNANVDSLCVRNSEE